LAILIQIRLHVLLQARDQLDKELACFAEADLDVADSLGQVIGAIDLALDLTLLQEIPKKAHGPSQVKVVGH